MDGAMTVMLRNKREAANGTVQKPPGNLYHMMTSLLTTQTDYFVIFRKYDSGFDKIMKSV